MKNMVFAFSSIVIFTCVFGADRTAQPSVENTHQDQVVNQFLILSGLDKQLIHLPEQIISGANQARVKSTTKSEDYDEIDNILTDSFPKDGFINRVTSALNKHFDEKRYTHMTQMLSTPLAKRMTKLEALQPSSVDLQEFNTKITANPLSHKRTHLLERLDSAMQSSTMLTKITITTFQLNALAMADDCGKNTSEIEKWIVKIRPIIEKSSRKLVQLTFAYTYRDVTDFDLSEYITIYETADAKWMRGYINTAIEEEVETGISKEAQEMGRLIQSKKPKQSMFAPKCPGDENGKLIKHS